MADLFQPAEQASLLHLANEAERAARAIGRRLEYIRQMALLTKAELAPQMGMSEDELAGYEAGSIVPTREIVTRFLEALPKK